MRGDHPACTDCGVTLSFLANGDDGVKHYTCPCCNAHTKHDGRRVTTIKAGSPLELPGTRRRSTGVIAALVGAME